MADELLLSTAYFPPAEYFSLIKNSETVLIEQEENYMKQTYRNRCKILASNGYSVTHSPGYERYLDKGSNKRYCNRLFKKMAAGSLRALISPTADRLISSFILNMLRRYLLSNHKFLMDLNDELLFKCLELLNIDKCISHTYSFKPARYLGSGFQVQHIPQKKSRVTNAFHIFRYSVRMDLFPV